MIVRQYKTGRLAAQSKIMIYIAVAAILAGANAGKIRARIHDTRLTLVATRAYAQTS